MSREPSPERLQLYAELGDEVRASQRSTDVVDDLLCLLMGINRSDARCLDVLDQHGSMSAGDLAEASRLTTGAITAVIDRLERAGLARRMVEPMRQQYTPMADDYSEDDLRLILDFTRRGREIQERHAEWLRERLAERR